MVVELVSLRCVGTDERSTAHSQIGTHLVLVLVEQEVLLLAAERRVNTVDPLVGAEDAQDSHRLLAQGIDRSQERCLLVERLAGPRDERRWNAQCSL